MKSSGRVIMIVACLIVVAAVVAYQMRLHKLKQQYLAAQVIQRQILVVLQPNMTHKDVASLLKGMGLTLRSRGDEEMAYGKPLDSPVFYCSYREVGVAMTFTTPQEPTSRLLRFVADEWLEDCL